ncbi:3'-5' exonuclease [Crenobacter luteus]|uniref:3'-5' exonuclease n=1 Tax=Crenobacter luteus TaxID=1452487 RepID=A0A163CQS9_9NEIS|nr:3'-5' exonuclease [Crenobacter luteus]
MLDKDAIRALPPFAALRRDAIELVDAASLADACRHLAGCAVLGFDTESRPTFRVGEAPTGPHLLQLATEDAAFLFPLETLGDLAPLRGVLAAPSVRKVGFDLKSDRALLKAKLDVECDNLVDLGTLFRAAGARHTIGAVQAVAQLFGQSFRKSKKLSTSNWSRLPLTDAQCEYAGNDAYVALRVYLALTERGLGQR